MYFSLPSSVITGEIVPMYKELFTNAAPSSEEDGFASSSATAYECHPLLVRIRNAGGLQCPASALCSICANPSYCSHVASLLVHFNADLAIRVQCMFGMRI